MSSKQQKSRRMEMPGLGYRDFAASQVKAKPFSIRHYALKSREQNIVQSWPFQQKYLNLFLNKGVNNILPPLETPRTGLDGLHKKLVIDFSLNKKEKISIGKIGRTKLDATEKISKPGKDSSTGEDTFRLLCGRLSRLSLTYNDNDLVGPKRRLVSKSDDQICGEVQSFNVQTSFHESMCDKGRRRKVKTKTKSLVEILAVAKSCILDGNDRIAVSGYSSTESLLQNVDEQPKNNSYKLKSWSRKKSSCRTAQTQKKPGGLQGPPW